MENQIDIQKWYKNSPTKISIPQEESSGNATLDAKITIPEHHFVEMKDIEPLLNINFIIVILLGLGTGFFVEVIKMVSAEKKDNLLSFTLIAFMAVVIALVIFKRKMKKSKEELKENSISVPLEKLIDLKKPNITGQDIRNYKKSSST